MSLTVAMRCLSGPKVGMGHLMRCREIARHLSERSHRAIIMGPATALQTPHDRTIFTAWVPEAGCFDAETDCAAFLAFCTTHRATHANMDDYRITPAYQKALRDAGIRTLQQFDASKPWPFWADFIVNSGPSEKHEDYIDYLPNTSTQCLFGPAYAVLRPAFAQITTRPDGRPLKRLFVCFGGGDDEGTLGWVITTLQAALGDHITFVAVCAKTNPAAIAYQDTLGILPQVDYQIDPPDIADLMRSCDAAILAGGTMSYEAAICGLPMILMALAPNQRRACTGWQAQIGALFLGEADQVTPEALVTAVTRLIETPSQRRMMAEKGRIAVDGRGVIRLVDALLDTHTIQDLQI